MGKYYVTGGTQHPDARGNDEWFSYGEAAIFLVDDSDGSVTKCVTYTSEKGIGPEHEKANNVFKAGSIIGNRLVACTQTEVLIYSLPGFDIVGRISHPWLNDVHHVVVNKKGNFLIANTGLDMVLELSPDAEVVQEISVLPNESIWDRFDRDTDYRKVLTTKPHASHPNYVFEVNDELWVTRFNQKDLLCLSNPEKRIDIGIEKVHDGNIFNGKIFATTVNGFLVIADPVSCNVLKTHNLNEITKSNKILSWCRSIHILDEDRVIVGFSRIRPSKFRENVQWAKFVIGKRESAGNLPTRIVLFNLANKSIEWTINLEEHNLNAVFSILPAK